MEMPVLLIKKLSNKKLKNMNLKLMTSLFWMLQLVQVQDNLKKYYIYLKSELRTTVYKRDINRNYVLKTKAARTFFNDVLTKYPVLCFS